MYELSNFDAIQISIASPEKIREWSRGEVTKPETINYRTQKPEPDGLFCERIFGPTRDWECHCGRYKKIRYRGVICEKCGVEVTKSKVRRERMGHIELACPVTHIWYLKGVPSRIASVLNVSPKDLENVVYFVSYIVMDPGTVPGIAKKQVLSDKEYRNFIEQQEEGQKLDWKLGQGAEAVQQLLQEVDLEKESKALKEVIANSTGANRQKAVKRLAIVEAFRKSGNKPEWMVLNVLPVLPPELRPLVQLDGGRFAASDLNELYRRVINRNNRLKKLKEVGSAEIILNNEKRMLQEAVDALIDNGRRGKAFQGAGNRELKSLSGYLAGKQGRFRQNLLGKRVDYSGRSVIVVGPELKLHQCGLPKEMALELFKPFIIQKLTKGENAVNPRKAKTMIEQGRSEVWDILEEIIKDHPVLLNRAPTLHRLGIQAFEPVLVEGRAIKLHPLACTAFNADFDGDQMAVHVPLSIEAQAEARILMLCTNNILKLADGKPVVSPSQDMVIGTYYLTIIKPGAVGEGHYFSSVDEAMIAYHEKELTLQSLCYIRVKGVDADGNAVQKTLHTTLGRCIFNQNIPQTLRFVDRTKNENACALEVEGILGADCCIDNNQFQKIIDLCKDGKGSKEELCKILKKETLTDSQVATINEAVVNNKDIDITDKTIDRKVTDFRNIIQTALGRKCIAIGKSQLSKIIDNCFQYYGATETAVMLDNIKALGYKYSTIGAITASVFDMNLPCDKSAIIQDARNQIEVIKKKYNRGLLSETDRYNAVIKTWDNAQSLVESKIASGLDDFNPIWMMANSGARGSMKQIRQLAGLRGLMSDPSGKTIELPVTSSFRDGLSVLDYFISSHGGRKGLADTALKTADSGYLTRRLVDVSHAVIVREQDCGDSKGLFTTPIINEGSLNTKIKIIEELAERISGRFSATDIVDPYTGEVICEKDHLITPDEAKRIDKVLTMKWEEEGANKHNLPGVYIRTVLTCKTKDGVCVKCYGKNMASGNPVKIGEAVGIIAAQSIGEPGTQLTMRTFHSGGVATDDDITQGLPRVEELFEARKPKGEAVITLNDGAVTISQDRRSINVTGNMDSKDYPIPFGANIVVKDGEILKAGESLTRGSINPQHMMAARGVKGVQEYITREVQLAYRQNSVEINDKHIEVIVRQMLRKVRIEDQCDSDLLPGTLVDRFVFEQERDRVANEHGKVPKAKPVLLGVTKTALATESFLSAASFQETSKVLADAAINSKVDNLVGLKENVIIGKLIPAGTGMKCYRNIVAVNAEERKATVEENIAKTSLFEIDDIEA